MFVLTDSDNIVKAVSLIPGLQEFPHTWHRYFPVQGKIPAEGSVFVPDPETDPHLYRGSETCESIRIRAFKFAANLKRIEPHDFSHDGIAVRVHVCDRRSEGALSLGFFINAGSEFISVMQLVSASNFDRVGKSTADNVDFKYDFTDYSIADYQNFIRAGLNACGFWNRLKPSQV